MSTVTLYFAPHLSNQLLFHHSPLLSFNNTYTTLSVQQVLLEYRSVAHGIEEGDGALSLRDGGGVHPDQHRVHIRRGEGCDVDVDILTL